MGLSWAHPCPDRDWCTPPKSMEINIISKWLTNGLADPKTPSGDPQPAATTTPEKAVPRGGWIYGFGGRTHSSWILASCGLRWYKFTVCVCVNASSHYRISLFFFFFNLLYQLLLQANVNSLLWTWWIMTPLTVKRENRNTLSLGHNPLFSLKLLPGQSNRCPLIIYLPETYLLIMCGPGRNFLWMF